MIWHRKHKKRWLTFLKNRSPIGDPNENILGLNLSVQQILIDNLIQVLGMRQ